MSFFCLFTIGEVAPSVSSKISSSRLNELEAQPNQTLDPRGTDQANMHSGHTNNITSELTTGAREKFLKLTITPIVRECLSCLVLGVLRF